jgi:hypothetical protein
VGCRGCGGFGCGAFVGAYGQTLHNDAPLSGAVAQIGRGDCFGFSAALFFGFNFGA